MPYEPSDVAISPDVHELLSRPDVSFWLKKAIKDNENRDPLDALNDAELLLSVQRARVKVLQG